MSEKSQIFFTPISPDRVKDYSKFLKEIFNKDLFSPSYLEWLYFNNPSGNVVGFDAYEDGGLIGHYACIPIQLDCYIKPALLSLNTAVDRHHQGRGIFKNLADLTFNSVSEEFSCVVGVANKLSFRGFTRHLGFEHVGDLDLRFGFLNRPHKGRRVYNLPEVRWRSACPARSFNLISCKRIGFNLVIGRVNGKFPVIASVKLEAAGKQGIWSLDRFILGITIDWRKGKKPLIFLPRRLKPSPLHFIFKPLVESECKITSWSFPDFDVI